MQIGIDLGSTKIQYVLIDNNNIELKRDRVQTPKNYEKTIILITHNVHHAYPVGNSFTVLNRGKSLGTYEKKDISREKLLSMMAGGEELNKLEVELQEMNRSSTN